MTSQPIPALILAGRRAAGTDPMVLGNAAHKAFLPLNDRPMLDYVLSALSSSPGVGPISISAPGDLGEGFAAHAPGATLLPAQTSPARSIQSALGRFQDAPAVLVTTCDHPLLTPAIISEFLSRAETANADAAIGCVTKDVFQASFPEAKRTFIRLKDLEFSGANLFLLKPRQATGLMAFWATLEANRKSPLTMARMIGVGIGIRYLLGWLTLEQMTAGVLKRSGTRCAMVPLDHPRAAIDVDKPADIALAASLLSA
ncbi:MAG: nucleotidyltransferase family protein [Pseudomonadota bacterium]